MTSICAWTPSESRDTLLRTLRVVAVASGGGGTSGVRTEVERGSGGSGLEELDVERSWGMGSV